MNPTTPLEIASAVRNACIHAALDGYENAQIAGLCQEGAWEVAIDAIRTLDIKTIVEATTNQDSPSPPGPSSA